MTRKQADKPDKYYTFDPLTRHLEEVPPELLHLVPPQKVMTFYYFPTIGKYCTIPQD